jgi:hypothetical protein
MAERVEHTFSGAFCSEGETVLQTAENSKGQIPHRLKQVPEKVGLDTVLKGRTFRCVVSAGGSAGL